MKKLLLIPAFGIAINAFSQQPILDSWIMNNNGQYASYWQNIGGGGPPNYIYVTTTDSADVLQVCYTSDSVWVRSEGMTFNMGQYLNPGGCEPQGYVFRFPRTSTVPTTKTISPKTGAIGLLLNGIPIYGLSNSASWDGSANTPMGYGIWNSEVYLSEGFVLDTAFGAHPQQDGAYHTHATPWRMYNSYPTNVHSPIVGYAFDGYPVYGPYGYVNPTDSTSGITRMKTGYSLRNITVRETLPYGVSLSPSQYGPAVSSTYPIGTYCEDYEWLSSNGGDLDKYNGRYCVTPEYPNGTYAYFVTMDAAGTPEFPYYIGIEYYGEPDAANLVISTTLSMPSSASCVVGMDEVPLKNDFTVYPNPAEDYINIDLDDYYTYKGYQVVIRDGLGRMIYNNSLATTIHLDERFVSGLYFVYLINAENEITGVKKLIVK